MHVEDLESVIPLLRWDCLEPLRLLDRERFIRKIGLGLLRILADGG
jgi:hypothetical protein